MADYSGAISLPRAHTSDDDSSDHSPHSLPNLSTPASVSASATSSKTKATNSKINIIDQHHQIIQSSVENATRKPRGRPPGSKNKPKPPVVITRDTDSAMKPVILEISSGTDIIAHIISFARRNHTGISVISASGSVSNVTLCQPNSHAPSLSLRGPFNLLSLSGSFFGSCCASKSSLTSPSTCSSSSSVGSSSSSLSFGVTLAGAQGQVFGGIVAGKVTAASQVVVVAATFLNPSFHSLPICEEGEHEQADHPEPKCSISVGGASESCASAGKSSVPVYGVGVASPTPINCQISPDVMHWAPSRPPY